jgi:hypothetical protein
VDVPVSALEDNTIDPTLTVTATMTSGGTAYTTGTSSATVNILDGDTRTISVGSPSTTVGGTTTLEIDVAGLFSQADPITVSGYDPTIVTITQTSLTWTGTSEIVQYQVTGVAAGDTSIFATDAAGNIGTGLATVG